MSGFYVKVGDSARFTKTVGEYDVYSFAGITGDFSPNHTNKAYMEKSSYGRLQAHGALMVGYMSTASTLVIAHTREGADETPVSLGYDRIRFLAPVYFGDTITVDYRISAIDEKARRSTGAIEIKNQDGVLVAVGGDGPFATITGTNSHIMERNRRALATLLPEPVVIRGHTDLAVVRGGLELKFSGNAQRRRRQFLLFHGTILTHFDLTLVERVLRFPSKVPDYRAIDAATTDLQREVAERRQAEQERASSEARLRTILDSAPLGIAFLDPHGKLLHGNPRLFEMLGRPAEKLLGEASDDGRACVSTRRRRRARSRRRRSDGERPERGARGPARIIAAPGLRVSRFRRRHSRGRRVPGRADNASRERRQNDAWPVAPAFLHELGRRVALTGGR